MPVPYERFDAWKECHGLALAVYQAIEAPGASVGFDIRGEARQAAFSAAAGLAVGAARSGGSELRRAVDACIGSLAELSYALRLMRDLNMLDEAQWKKLDTLRDGAAITTWKLYVALAPGRKKRKS